MGYGFIPLAVMIYLLIRTGILYGPKIPLVFIGLVVIGRFCLPEILGPYRFEIFVACLAIILVLIDRFKSIPWDPM